MISEPTPQKPPIDIQRIIGTIVIIAAICLVAFEYVVSPVLFPRPAPPAASDTERDFGIELPPEDTSEQNKGPACCPRPTGKRTGAIEKN